MYVAPKSPLELLAVVLAPSAAVNRLHRAGVFDAVVYNPSVAASAVYWPNGGLRAAAMDS